MKLTIIREDGSVYKDGLAFSDLDLSDMPSNVHALQWENESGWIEFVNESEFRKPSNQDILELPYWAEVALVKWQSAKDAHDAANAIDAPQATVSGAQMF